MTPLYQVQATLTHITTDTHGISCQKVISIPTFYIDPDIQGILTHEHACKVAREIILPVELQFESVELNLNIILVEV